MRQLYTSDIHFGHAQCIAYNGRPFNNVDEMDRELIRMWNDKVCRTDHVYILGDVCFRNERPEEWYLKQLKGHLHLIIGNHDGKLLKNERAMRRFQTVDLMKHISDNKRQIHACHFPMAEWNGFYRNSWHVYGHVHNRITESVIYMSQFDRALNAGMDINGFVPVTFDEMLKNNVEYKKNADFRLIDEAIERC